MNKITFSIPGVPRGKGRPKFARRGNYVKTYTDAQTMNYENRILIFFKQAAPGHKPIPRGTPISITMSALFPIPQSFSKTKRTRCFEYLGAPDCDNVIKCLDALNAVAWVDDRQIWSATFQKQYSNEAPRLDITIEWDTSDTTIDQPTTPPNGSSGTKKRELGQTMGSRFRSERTGDLGIKN